MLQLYLLLILSGLIFYDLQPFFFNPQVFVLSQFYCMLEVGCYFFQLSLIWYFLDYLLYGLIKQEFGVLLIKVLLNILSVIKLRVHIINSVDPLHLFLADEHLALLFTLRHVTKRYILIHNLIGFLFIK